MSFTADIDDVVAENRNKLLGAHPSWNRVKVREFAAILNGFPFESSRFSKSDGFPLIRIRDILSGQTETFYKGEFDSAFLVRRGDILVGMDGDFHCAPWGGDPALLNQRVCKIVLDEDFCLKAFFRYILPGYLDAINAQTPSVTVKHLSSRTVADIPIPVPSITEQRRIVAEIEKQFTRLEAGITALKRAQANLKRYRAAVLKAACEVGLVYPRVLWPTVALSELGEVLCGQSPSTKDVNSTEDGVPYISGPEHWDGNTVHINKWTTAPKRQVPDGCVFITVKGAGVGTVFPGVAAAIGRDVYAFNPNERILARFLEYALRHTTSEVIRSAKGDIPGLSKSHIVEHEILLPPLAEQKRIVEEVERRLSVVEELEAVVKLNLDRATRLRQSILQKAFSGELSG